MNNHGREIALDSLMECSKLGEWRESLRGSPCGETVIAACNGCILRPSELT